MAFGFQVNDSTGTAIISSTETSALLKEQITTSSTGSGSKTYTDATGQTAYGFGMIQTNGNAAAGTWGSYRFNVSTGVDGNNNPTFSYNIQCYDTASGLGFNPCGNITNYHVFAFTK